MASKERTLLLDPVQTAVDFVIHSRIAYHAARLALAAAFLIAAVYKFVDLDHFASTISAFGLLPSFMVDWAALLLPVAEFFGGLALAFDIRGGLAVLTALTIIFITVLGYGIALGLDIDCGCYGPGDPEAQAFSSLHTSLYRDFGLLALAGYCFFWRIANQRRPLGLREFVTRLIPPSTR